MQAARIQALTYRAAYALAAAKRLSSVVLAADLSERLDALRKALAAERWYLAAHVDMTKRRLAGARATSSMAELHGPILSWNHGETRTPVEPRPMHLAADGMNFDASLGPPAIIGVWPGVLSWCSCAAGPPKTGAGRLAAGSGRSLLELPRTDGDRRGSGGERRKQRLAELKALGPQGLAQRIRALRAARRLPKLRKHFKKHGKEVGANTIGEYDRLFKQHLTAPGLRFFSFIRNQDKAKMWIAVNPATGHVSQYNEDRSTAFSFYGPPVVEEYVLGREKSAIEVIYIDGEWRVRE